MKRIFILTIVILFFVGCKKPITPTEPSPTPSEPTPQAPESRIALAWENTTAPHPERKSWSDHLIEKINEDLDIFSSAKDITTFCPKYKSLDSMGKKHAWGELWVATAYYESGYNPGSSSVDVGSKTNKDTWSVGLFQMSVVDQANYGFNFGYSYNDLLTPNPNIDLALAIMTKQISKHGKILIATGESGLYWATLHPGGKYDETSNIVSRVKKYTPECN